jgi:hypothetical protein
MPKNIPKRDLFISSKAWGAPFSDREAQAHST